MLRMLPVGAYQANCYIIGCKNTLEGAVIDPGDELQRIIREITKLGLKVKYILLTHGHFDHTGAAEDLSRITGAPVLIHPYDESGLGFTPDGHLAEGQIIEVGTFDLRVIHTPGHTPGGVCFYGPGVVFTGDTLFAGSVGRTDFAGGNHAQLILGVKQKIFPLGDDVRVYPGHGPPSSIGRERLTNPFFQGYVARP